MPQSGNPTAPPNRAAMSRRNAARALGRYQGDELFFQQPFATLTQPIIPRNLNLTRPMESLHFVWRGRVVIATANYTAVAAEAPATIIQKIRVTGTHRTFNQLVPIDISGATAFAYMRLFQVRGNTSLINGVKQPEPSVPYAQAGATFGNTGTYDLEIHYSVPVTPILAPNSRLSTIPYLWFPQDWADSIQIQLFFGDATSFGTPAGGTVVTFSAFGSGAGSPTVSIFANYSILGQLATAFNAAVVVRNEQLITSGLANAATGQRVSLLQKQRTLGVMIKSGILLTGTTAGVSVFASLSDTMLERTQIVLDNKPVRNNMNNFAAKEYVGRMFNTVYPQGYLNFPFDESMTPQTMYRGDLIPGGSNFELDSDIISANANNAVTMIQEQVFGTPGARAGQ